LSDIPKNRPLKEAEAIQKLNLIAETSRRGVENIRDFLFSNDREGKSLGALVERMSDYGNKVFENSNVEFILTQTIPDRAYSLSPLHIFNIYLIYKEAITNVIKHARARKIDVRIDFDHEGMKMDIRDDGIGFDLTAVSCDCHGIKNIQTRAEEIGGMLAIESAPGQGAQVNLSIPL
jgi:signal transduction histidine kinase